MRSEPKTLRDSSESDTESLPSGSHGCPARHCRADADTEVTGELESRIRRSRLSGVRVGFGPGGRAAGQRTRFRDPGVATRSGSGAACAPTGGRRLRQRPDTAPTPESSAPTMFGDLIGPFSTQFIIVRSTVTGLQQNLIFPSPPTFGPPFVVPLGTTIDALAVRSPVVTRGASRSPRTKVRARKTACL